MNILFFRKLNLENLLNEKSEILGQSSILRQSKNNCREKVKAFKNLKILVAFSVLSNRKNYLKYWSSVLFLNQNSQNGKMQKIGYFKELM